MKAIQIGERCGTRVVTAIDPRSTVKHKKLRVLCDCGFETVVCSSAFRSNPRCKQCSDGMRNLIKVGERCGSRVAIAIDRQSPTRPLVHFRCDCGHEQKIAATSFRTEGRGCKFCRSGGWKLKYRELATDYRLYKIWTQMRRRCRPSGDDHSKYWGDLGITVHPEWNESFVAFEAWSLANGYQKNLTIDRVESDGNYEPSNCEWITKRENSQRMRAQYQFVRLEKLCSGGIPSFGS